MVRIIQMGEITRPATTPFTSTILDHATVGPDVSSFGLRNNEGLWPSYNCLDTLTPTNTCADPLATDEDFKQFSSAEWVPSFEFAVHGGVQCQAIGLDKADMESEIKRVFEINEAKGIEQALAGNRFVANSDGLWDAPVNVTPSGAVPLHVAVALLESYAATMYAGVPTLHLPRGAATLLADRVEWVGGKAYTTAGSKVVFGSGYDTDIGATSWEIYATGEVYVEKSSRLDFNSFVIPGDGSGTGSGQNGIEENTQLALVERMYRVAVDCFVAKATGTIITSNGGGGGMGTGVQNVVDNGDGTF